MKPQPTPKQPTEPPPEHAAEQPIAHVSSRSVAANLRLLSVGFEGADELDPIATREFHGRVDRIVSLFLEKHWPLPRRTVAIVPLSYLLFPAPLDNAFEADVEALTDHLARHLFGEGVEIRCLIGEPGEVERLAAAPEETFRTAHAAAEAAVNRLARARAAALAARSAAAAAHPASPKDPEALDDIEIADPAPVEDPAIARARLRPVRSSADARWKAQLRLFAGYDAPRKAVLCYVATLGRGPAPAAPVLYDELGRVSGAKLEDVERAALGFAARKVAVRLESGAAGYCLVPLSYESLADRRRREAFLAEAAALPEDIRRLLLPSVFGGPPAPSSRFLMEIVGTLRMHFPHVDWTTRSCTLELDPMKHAQMFAVTLALPAKPAERAIELARLPSLVRRLNALQIRAGVAGLAERAELDAAIAARAHYLSGPVVSAELTDLVPELDLAIERLPLGGEGG
jgi:hypothetical protein